VGAHVSLAAALDLARLALPVFPCGEDKRPLTPHGFKDGTRNYDNIRRWWNRWPDALIGVPAGDRFVVLDVDLKHETARHWWDAHRERLSATRMHHTRSGGLHLIMKPHPRFTCSAGKIELGIDTRGKGGYAIWWPAHGYKIVNLSTMLPVPDWLLEALHPPAPPRSSSPLPIPARADRSIAGLIRSIANATEGERNHVTFWGACRFAELVKQGAITETAAVDIIIEAASRAGLHHDEARRTAASAFRTTRI
jgi:Bifunctional DNA primase/polymerase, N-terminal